jgi:YidC/Oxa1 family membrane protein insertase
MHIQQPDNQKNLLLAIILSIGVLLGWQMFYAGPKLKEEQDRLKREKEVAAQQAPAAPGAATGGLAPAAPGTQPTGVPGAIPGGATRVATRDDALKSSPRAAIDTPSLKGSIALKGGRIDDLRLAKYRETTDRNSPTIILFSPAEAPEPYFAEHGWVGQGVSPPKLPDRDTLWRTEGNTTLTPDRPVTLVWDNGQGLKFRRTVSVDRDYMFKVADEVENAGASEVTLYPYARIFRLGTPVTQGFFILHEGLIGILGDKLQEHAYSDVLKNGGDKSFEQSAGGWLGFTDKYWAAALVPSQSELFNANMSAQKKTTAQKESYQAHYTLGAVTLAPGAKRSVEGHLFAGAKEVQLFSKYRDTLAIKKFDYMIDWGWFYFITKPLYYLIHWLNGLFKNFGLAILAVTVLVKLAFFPLANKSYESMAKMKKMQPEMERIRDLHKDDKAAQQKALMELYQKQKINPLAGCLPVLVQIPVFFALYKVLFVTIDMRHAPFFGWIRDLSAADPTSLFNLFGLLPFGVPEFLQIGVWPLIMGVTMWLQMQLNPQNPDPIQQQIFNWMPVMFTFMLGTFPAGLVIYWAWNNVLSIIQQVWIMQKNGVENPIWKNLGLEWLAEHLKPLTSPPAPIALEETATNDQGRIESTKVPAQPPPDGAGESAIEAPAASEPPKAPGMTREQALKVLGLHATATEAQVEKAYNERIKRFDPAKLGSDAKSARLVEARNVLKASRA